LLYFVCGLNRDVLDWILSSSNLPHHQITGQPLMSQYPWARSQASN
jgi:hypothetical protein